MIKFQEFDSYEDELAKRSISWISKEEKGKEYLKLFKLAASFNYALVKDFSYQENDDQLTVKYLGSRIFNFGITSYRSILSGYYQVGFSLMREFVESNFLVDYFQTDKSEITRWKNASNKTLKNEFSPNKLYTKLDKRDKFTGEERKRQYQLFCEYAAHASYGGFKLLTNDDNLIETGFFFNSNKLLNGIAELSRRYGLVVLGLAALLPAGDIETTNCQIKLLVQFQKVFGTDATEESNRKLIALLRKMKGVLIKSKLHVDDTK